MINGNYEVHYGNHQTGMFGLGRVTLKDGMVTGSDAGYGWKGTYKIEGSKLLATIEALQEHGAVNVFGDTEDIELHLSGDIGEQRIDLRGIRSTNPSHHIAISLSPIAV